MLRLLLPRGTERGYSAPRKKVVEVGMCITLAGYIPVTSSSFPYTCMEHSVHMYGVLLLLFSCVHIYTIATTRRSARYLLLVVRSSSIGVLVIVHAPFP